MLVSQENGKTLGEGIAEIEKCIELTEFATSLPQLVTGEVLEVSKGVECRTEHVPLGVVAPRSSPSISPAMVPSWTMPNALGAGQLHDHEALRKSAAQPYKDRRPC